MRRSSIDYDSDELPHSIIDAETAAKQILAEYGPKACVIDEPCKIHAMRPGRAGAQPDWMDILRYVFDTNDKFAYFSLMK